MTNEKLRECLQNFSCSKELYGYTAHALARLVTEEVLPRMELLDENACARHMEERKRMRQEQYWKSVTLDRADVLDVEGLEKIDFSKMIHAANSKEKEGLL